MTQTDSGINRKDIRLQVLISTMGGKGIGNVAAAIHPAMDGVEYLVGWQVPEGDIPQELRHRPDFRIFPHSGKGLSRNRNYLLGKATAPLILISDDDISYTEDGLRRVIEAFGRHPEAHLLTFRYDTEGSRKIYPEGGFDLADPPRGYYLSSIELAMRLDAVREAGIRFNEHFGLGSDGFISGEEVLLMHDSLKAGLSGFHIPEIICTHPADPTTRQRERANPEQEMAKGAVTSRLHPASWPFRMVLHAIRSRDFGAVTFTRAWLHGIRRARRMKVWNPHNPHCPNRHHINEKKKH